MLGYISDDERPRSPGLQAVVVKYTPPPSPISFVPRRRQMPEWGSGGQQSSRKRARGPSGDRVRPSQGDVVLLGHLDPNRPDIAVHSGKRTLFQSDSASEKTYTNDEDEDDDDEEEESRIDEDENNRGEDAKDTQQFQSLPEAHERVRDPPNAEEPNAGSPSPSFGADAEMPDAPSSVIVGEQNDNEIPGPQCNLIHYEQNTLSLERNLDHQATTKHQIRCNVSYDRDGSSHPKVLATLQNKSQINLPHVSESITASPKLAPHIMSAPQRSPQESQYSSHAPITSPAPQEQSLPSVQHLVRVAETQDEALLQRRPRTASLSSVNSAFTPAASAYTSATPTSATSSHFFGPKTSQPPLPPQQQLPSLTPLGRIATDPTPLPLPIPPTIRHASTNPANFAMATTSSMSSGYTHSITSTSTADATPSSLNDAPTPSDRSSTLSLPSPERTAHTRITTIPITAPSIPGASLVGTPTSPLYKCTFPGCRAQPFQTPYLLNSHRNVHSSDRPYFCPRRDCPRSQPGKGFKRKNEMLRHGLVHDSPGYVCPFCGPEKEHRYPRPDNLQRHVKMHHEGVDMEDGRLREVLGQRRMVGVHGPVVGSIGGGKGGVAMITEGRGERSGSGSGDEGDVAATVAVVRNVRETGADVRAKGEDSAGAKEKRKNGAG